MSKVKRREQVWPSIEERGVVARIRTRRSAPPLDRTEPIGAYAAYLAWLELEARAAVELGLRRKPAA